MEWNGVPFAVLMRLILEFKCILAVSLSIKRMLLCLFEPDGKQRFSLISLMNH